MLTDTAIKSARPMPNKDYKIHDERGMYLLVTSGGGKYFRIDYRLDGKRKTLALGVYPETSLKQARDKRDTARKLISGGISPTVSKPMPSGNFEMLFNEWVSLNKNWSEKYRNDVMSRARLYFMPLIGNMPVEKITHDDLIRVIDRMKAKGISSKTLQKTHSHISYTYQLAIAKRLCDRNIAHDVTALLPTGSHVKARASISEAELPDFIRKVNSYPGRIETKIALRLLLFTATRPQETYASRWCEFELDKALWTIPIERMKLRRTHVVPLPSQAVSDLIFLRTISGHHEYLFPNQQDSKGHMSENTLNVAIKKHLGFNATSHGLRATFSTIVNTHGGFRNEAIESCLAHVTSGIAGIYNRSDYLNERRTIMQWWADYLAALNARNHHEKGFTSF